MDREEKKGEMSESGNHCRKQYWVDQKVWVFLYHLTE